MDEAPLKKIELKEPPVKTKKKSFLAVKIIGFTFLIFILILAALGGLGYALVYQPGQTVYRDAMNFAQTGQKVMAAVKSQNIAEAKSGLAESRSALDTLKSSYSRLLPLKAVPFLGAYVKDGEHAISAAAAGLSAGDNAIEALEPNADLLGLTGGSSFVSGTADERIQTAVATMRALTPKITEMAGHIKTLETEIDRIDPARYPEQVRGQEVRSRLVSLKETIRGAAGLFVNAQPLLNSLPAILGDPDERRYLVLFQNDKELRATGGFITAYARFRLVKGKIILEKADDIYALDASLSKSYPAPPEILTYHKDVFTFHIRDSNLSPDFEKSMETFLSMYNEARGIEKVDGIIAVDTHVLVEALRILGPMSIYGREFSAEIDKRCDCPRAVYELEDYSTRPVNYVREDRKDIIGILLKDLMQKALGVSPSQYWGQLFQMLLTEINKKHVLAYFVNEEEQQAAVSFNMAGKVLSDTVKTALFKYDGTNAWDYLFVVNSNMAGAKSNMFVSSKMNLETVKNSDGTRTNTLTIDYNNPYPGSDCGLESGGLCLNAPLRNWVRIYVPKGSTLVKSQGSQSPKDRQPVDLKTGEDLGKTVFEGFLIVNPLGTAKLSLTYTVPAGQPDGKYQLFVQKQPGTEGDEFTLTLDGKAKKPFPIAGDTELTY